ncbi:MAG: patatin-like phospholipase family protein [Candidatus Nanopelagicales bacterium]
MAQIELADRLPGPVAYVLAGGASFGATQWGHIRALAQTDLRPDFVVGTSVGSLNGAVLAEDPEAAPERLTELWTSATRQEIFGNVMSHAVNLATGRPAAVSNDGLREFIERALSARVFGDLTVPFTAMATDFDTGRAISLDSDDLISALLASAAIPLVFPAVERKGRRLVDGGLVANVPIRVAAELGAQTLVVLDCGFTVMPPEREDTATSRLLRTAAIMAAQQVRRDLEQVTDRTVIYLPGPWPIRTRPDDFRKSAEIASATYGLTMSWLHALDPHGPGRYGTAPTDALMKSDPLPRPEESERIPDH